MVKLVRRRRNWFLIGAVLAPMFVLVVASQWPLKYTGTARFERRSPPATEGGAGGVGDFETYKSTLRQDLAGRQAVEAVLTSPELKKMYQELRLPHDPGGKLSPEGRPMLQDKVRSMQQDIVVNYEVRSDTVDLIAVSFTSDDRVAAQKVPNALVDHYIRQIVDKIKEQLKKNYDNIVESWKAANTKFEKARKERMDFEEKNAGKLQDTNSLGEQIIRITADIDELGRLKSAAEKNKTRLEQMAADAKAATEPKEGEEPEPAEVVWGPNPEIAALREQLRKINEELDIAVTVKKMRYEPPDNVHPTVQAMKDNIGRIEKQIKEVQERNPGTDGLRKQLKETQEKLDVAINTDHMAEDHPTVKALKDDIDRIEKQITEKQDQIIIQSVFRRPVRPLENPFAVELVDAQSQIESLSDAIGKKMREQERLQAVLTESVQRGQDHERLVTEEANRKAEADHYLGQQTQVERNMAAEMAQRRTNLYPVDEAQEQYKPSSPVLWQVLIMAVVAGLASGAGLVLLVHRLDRSITTTEEAMTYFDIPIYGVVGEIRTPRDLFWRRFKLWLVTPLVSLIIVVVLAWATANIVLRLEYPEKQWEWPSYLSDPAGWIVRQVTQ